MAYSTLTNSRFGAYADESEYGVWYHRTNDKINVSANSKRAVMDFTERGMHLFLPPYFLPIALLSMFPAQQDLCHD